MERTLVELLRTAQTPELKHAVVTLRSAGALAQGLPSNVPCLALGIRGSDSLSGLRLAKVLRRMRPQLLHARNPGCWADALLARILGTSGPLVLGFHGLESGGSFSRRDRVVAKTAMWLGAHFTAVSEAGAEQLTRELGVPPARITVLPNGVDLPRFARPASEIRSSVRTELGFSEDAIVVGTVGALTPIKRQDLLLEAFARCQVADRRLRLLLVGDGPCRGSLEDRAGLLLSKGQVVFAGRREDVPRLLAAMDAFVLCSDSEGMSNALLEAMAAGLPVVATRVGNNDRVLRDGVDGWIVPRRNAEALARAIQSAAADAEFRRQCGRSARRRAENFAFGETVQAYERFYRQRVLVGPRGVIAGRNAAQGIKEGPRTTLFGGTLKDNPIESENTIGDHVR